jgi:hypothetical protein
VGVAVRRGGRPRRLPGVRARGPPGRFAGDSIRHRRRVGEAARDRARLEPVHGRERRHGFIDDVKARRPQSTVQGTPGRLPSERYVAGQRRRLRRARRPGRLSGGSRPSEPPIRPAVAVRKAGARLRRPADARRQRQEPRIRGLEAGLRGPQGERGGVPTPGRSPLRQWSGRPESPREVVMAGLCSPTLPASWPIRRPSRPQALSVAHNASGSRAER